MYLFDNTLIANVLADPVFQRTGIVTDSDRGLDFAVIDPRRHNIDVWRKTQRTRPFRRLGRRWHRNYRSSITRINPAYATNGPPMEPDEPWYVPARVKMAWGIYWVGQVPWLPYDQVVSGGAVIDQGAGFIKAHFCRTGQGVFSAYTIAAGQLPGNALEGMGGLYHLVQGGGVVTSADTLNLQQAIGITAWGLCPIDDLNTDSWSTQVPYIDPPDPNPLTGVVIACGSGRGLWNISLAAQLILVGVTDAVATDGSDSALVVEGRNILVDCWWLKDEIQQYGFYAT